MADSIDWIIDYYKLDYRNCFFLVGDNTEVNPALARKLGLHFIGCHSHTLNLAIQNKVLKSDQLNTLLKKVHKMMKKLSTTKRRALLKTKTQLSPKFLNATRWSSCFNMIKRFTEIIGPVTELFTDDRENDRVADDAPTDHYSRAKMYTLIPNDDERLMLQEYYDMLHPFESITSNLQG
jgi:transcriptional regulator with GAF, ATPase, and Fis domain